MDPQELIRRLTANDQSGAFFKMNGEWARRRDERISLFECLSELLMSGDETILAVIDSVESLSPEAAEHDRLLEVEAQTYLAEYDPDLAGIFDVGRRDPEHTLVWLITNRSKGLRTFGEFLVNSLGIAFSYWSFSKRCERPVARDEMGSLFRKAYVVLRTLENA